ncbi:P-type conjugative transfer protein TrbL [Pseudoduganella ginsengisoli]|uniref:P-type conjugative transfer protein TrbL n=1 Tax=Pseudoduganella ginsengisoli TaxID=1462440 RepID=A0A6L6Q8V7_9BURK|nr:P-type conjugative transfer protein TrbL [Pseudoduganella ginsengisoli]MTW05899.1 P-type conjugative transfer protein TrbL [Pseudoduganella ginsengisoli]
MKRVLPTLGVTLIAFVSFLPTASAQLQADGILDTVIAKYQQAASQWAATLTGYASFLFWGLAGLSIVVTFGFMALRRADPMEFFAELFKFSFTTGFFWWLLSNGPAFAMSIINSLRKAGGTAAHVEGLGPSGIIDIGFNIFFKVLDKTSVWSPIDSLVGIILGLGLLFSLALIAANMLILIVSGWMLAYGGIFFLGFGGARWTSEMAISYYKTALGIGAAVMGMTLIVGVGETIITDFYNSMSAGLKAKEMTVMLIVGVIMYKLANTVPNMLAGMVGGNAAASAANVGGGTLLGAAALAGGAVATGGALAMAAATNVAGGASALKAAFSAAQENMANGTGMFAGGGSGAGNVSSLAKAMGSGQGNSSGSGANSGAASSGNSGGSANSGAASSGNSGRSANSGAAKSGNSGGSANSGAASSGNSGGSANSGAASSGNSGGGANSGAAKSGNSGGGADSGVASSGNSGGGADSGVSSSGNSGGGADSGLASSGNSGGGADSGLASSGNSRGGADSGVSSSGNSRGSVDSGVTSSGSSGDGSDSGVASSGNSRGGADSGVSSSGNSGGSVDSGVTSSGSSGDGSDSGVANSGESGAGSVSDATAGIAQGGESSGPTSGEGIAQGKAEPGPWQFPTSASVKAAKEKSAQEGAQPSAKPETVEKPSLLRTGSLFAADMGANLAKGIAKVATDKAKQNAASMKAAISNTAGGKVATAIKEKTLAAKTENAPEDSLSKGDTSPTGPLSAEAQDEIKAFVNKFHK